jgi:hypothetical protein
MHSFRIAAAERLRRLDQRLAAELDQALLHRGLG